MRRALALFLLFSLGLQNGFAGVGSQQAKLSGSTTATPPVGAVGVLDAKDQQQLHFAYKGGKGPDATRFGDGSATVPFATFTRVTYGDVKHLRVGQTIGLAALAGAGGLFLLMSKSHTHYLTIDYKDEKGQDQMLAFEVGKDAIQPLIDAIELRTGKKVGFETPAEAKAQQKK